MIDAWKCGNGYDTDVHELLLTPEGHALMLGVDSEKVRMDTIAPGGNPDAVVAGAIIQEQDQAKNVVFQWRSWDNFKITDATHEDLTASTIDYVHANALVLDTDGNILLSSRHMDEITKIDRKTGAILWRWGGKNNQFVFLNDPAGFSHQHAVRRLPGGDVTLFDNGNHHSPLYSRAAEYVLDETRKTATLVWEYRYRPDVYGSAMGYVQRLGNGNTLIGRGLTNPTVTEVSPDGTTSFELTPPQKMYSYRAYRFPWEKISPGSSTAPGVSAKVIPEQNYPNPFNASTTIQFSLPGPEGVSLEIYNALGEKLTTLLSGPLAAGTYAVQWNGTDWPSGAYFCRLAAGTSNSTRALRLVK